MEITVENRGSTPVVVDEYETAGRRYPATLLVSQGLDVDNKSPVTPGESKTIRIWVPKAKRADFAFGGWVTRSGMDNRSSGLLFFKDTAGSRYMVPIPSNIGAEPAKVGSFLLPKD
jgi:hypothetical protein